MTTINSFIIYPTVNGHFSCKEVAYLKKYLTAHIYSTWPTFLFPMCPWAPTFQKLGKHCPIWWAGRVDFDNVRALFVICKFNLPLITFCHILQDTWFPPYSINMMVVRQPESYNRNCVHLRVNPACTALCSLVWILHAGRTARISSAVIYSSVLISEYHRKDMCRNMTLVRVWVLLVEEWWFWMINILNHSLQREKI